MKIMLWLRRAALAVAAALPASAAAWAGPQYVDREGYALSGYDAVAYHAAGAPAQGRPEFAHDYNGATWLFSSAENRDLFAAAPETYAPAFDGHCSWAASRSYKAPADPEAWSVVDGRLYLNYNRDVRTMWEGDIPGHIAAGVENWPALETEAAAGPQ